MNEFYKKLREHKSLQQEHEIPEGAWDSFKDYEKEKEPESKKSGWFFWPLAAGLIGLLIGSVGMSSYSKVGGVLSGFSSIQHDTVYITKYVEVEKSGEVELENRLMAENKLLQRELKEAIVERNNAVKRYNQVAVNFDKLRLEHKTIIADFGRTMQELKTGLTSSSRPAKLEGIDPKDKDRLEQNRNSFETGLLILRNDISVLEEKSLFIEPLLAFLPTIKRRKKPISEWIRPKTFSLGAEIGMHALQDFYGVSSPIFVSEALVVSTLFTTRARGQFTIGNANFSGEDKDPLANPLIPVITPVENGTLKETKINRQVYFSSIGLEYILYKGDKWRPFVGLAFGGERHNYPSFNYEYDTPNGEIYQKLDTELDPEYVLNYKANIGVEYYLWKAMDIQVQAVYNRSKIYNQSIGLKTRLIYHF
ncbi:hypothetical protein N9B82_03550 [Saprospiraceae bacterium]|nr:hypothetical protein [Saprospiraceae bacterium]